MGCGGGKWESSAGAGADYGVWIVGLLGGVAVSSFSKTLAMLFGLLVLGVQVSDGAFLHLGGEIGKADEGDSLWRREGSILYQRHDYRVMSRG